VVLADRWVDAMSPRALWISVLCLLLYGTAWGKLWNAESFPNPNVEPDRCGRSGRKSSSICDPDSMISSTVRDTVDGIVNNLHEGKRGFKLGPCGSGYDGYQVRLPPHLKRAYRHGVNRSRYVCPVFFFFFSGRCSSYEISRCQVR